MRLTTLLICLLSTYLSIGQEDPPIPEFKLDKLSRPVEKLVNGVVQEKYQYLFKGAAATKKQFSTILSILSKSDYKFTLFKGDTITLAIKEKAEKNLSKIQFLDPKMRELITESKKTGLIQKLVVEQDGIYTLLMENKSSFSRRNVEVEFQRKPKIEKSTAIILRDTLFRTDTLQKLTVVDTQVINLLDETYHLPPTRNIENVPYQIIKLVLPTPKNRETRLIEWVYWIASTQAEIDAFQVLSETLPPEWTFQEAPIILGAYLLNKPFLFPKKRNNTLQISYTTSSPQKSLQRNIFPKSIYPITQKQNFGKVSKQYTPDSGVVYLVIKNNDPINGYPVKVQAIALQENRIIETIIERKIENIRMSVVKK